MIKITAVLYLIIALSLTAVHSHSVASSWAQQGEAWIESKRRYAPSNTPQQAKNIILFVGDGMGISTVTASRIRKGQLQGQSGEEGDLSFEAFPYTGLVKTYNTDSQVPDSAGTMTAIMTGEKTRKGLVGIGSEVARGDCAAQASRQLRSLTDLAKKLDKRVGIVSTTRITHATPAAVYAYAADRNWEDDSTLPKDKSATNCRDIAAQLIDSLRNNKVDLALGGGKANFLPVSLGGKRVGDTNLLQQSKRFRYVGSKSELLSVKTTLPLLGLFSDSHLPYADDITRDIPTLSDMTKHAIRALDNEKGYFLMIEAGRIDHAHHVGNAYHALGDTLALDKAVSEAMALTKESETLIIVTADHSHVMTMAGYPPRGNPILGSAGVDHKGVPYTTLAYANGRGQAHLPSAKTIDERYEHTIDPGRKKVKPKHFEAPHYFQESLVGLASETHGGEDVGVWARGPSAFYLTGTMEQTIIYYAMEAAFTSKVKSPAILPE